MRYCPHAVDLHHRRHRHPLSRHLDPRAAAVRARRGIPARTLRGRARGGTDADLRSVPADGARVAAHRDDANPIAEDHYQGQRLDRYRGSRLLSHRRSGKGGDRDRERLRGDQPDQPDHRAQRGRAVQPRSTAVGHLQHQRADQGRDRRTHRAVGHAGDGGRDQGHRPAGEHAAGDGARGRGRARAPRQDRRGRRRVPGRDEARRSRRYHHPAPGGAAAAHAADHGGNLDREELDHHLPGPVHDHGARGARLDEEGFGLELKHDPEKWIPAFGKDHAQTRIAMSEDGTRFAEVVAAIDAANARDPNAIEVDGQRLAAELVYGQRMSETLARLAPEASETLRIAARGQHIERWTSPRRSYPEGRAGYLRWRKDLQAFHAARVGEIMTAAGYDAAAIGRAGALIRKERLKADAEAQMLEDVACLVFLAHYLGDFLRKTDHDKLAGILAKTWNKMSPRGREAAHKLHLPAPVPALLEQGLARLRPAPE